MFFSNPSTASDPQSLKHQEEVLKAIADFADRICKDIPLTGKEESLELSAKGKADLSALLKKIADLGIQGGAKYQRAEYQGLLSKDLAVALKNSTDCKLKV